MAQTACELSELYNSSKAFCLADGVIRTWETRSYGDVKG